MTITPEVLTHITTRGGELNRYLAQHRDVQAQLAHLAAHMHPSVQVVVQVNGSPFTMRLPVATLIAQHEADLATITSRIAAIAAVPLDWIPQPPPALVPELSSPPASPEGVTTDE